MVERATARAQHAPAAGSVLADVLADLVDDGTITQQPDAITDAVDTRLAARRSEMEQRHQEMRAAAEQIRGFLEDEDHPG